MLLSENCLPGRESKRRERVTRRSTSSKKNLAQFDGIFDISWRISTSSRENLAQFDRILDIFHMQEFYRNIQDSKINVKDSPVF